MPLAPLRDGLCLYSATSLLRGFNCKPNRNVSMNLNILPSQQREFSAVKFHSTHKVITGQFPDFLVVGPQRTGTTWLTENMRFHPEIFMSFPKEIYFFNRLLSKDNTHSLHWANFSRSIRGLKPKDIFREIAKIAYLDFYKTGMFKACEIEWYLRFFTPDKLQLRYISKQLRSEHSSPFSPKIYGEATASYAVLPEAVIKEIVQLNPSIKIILMVRDPVQRAWSHAKKDLVRSKYLSTKDVSDQEFMDFFNDPYQLQCGSYTQQIDRWSKYVSDENLLVCVYENIAKDPEAYILNIFRFLGVSEDKRYIGKRAGEVINPTEADRIPTKLKEHLINLFKEEEVRLRERLGIQFSRG